MERKIGEHTLVFKDKLTFLDFSKIQSLPINDKGQTDVVLWGVMRIILISFDGNMGDEGITALQELDDIDAFTGILEFYAETMTKISESIEKKKK